MSDSVGNIGVAGQPWGAAEKKQWLAQQHVQRSYQTEVLDKLTGLGDYFKMIQYGALSYDSSRYPLYIIQPAIWSAEKPAVLVTGGVHGYETSGVQGALQFLKDEAMRYSNAFNIVVAPCVSPWGYETINRWNPQAIDPNRSFKSNGQAEESSHLMQYFSENNIQVDIHFDLHETTDTDNTVFRPALAARDNIEQKVWNIPDGFYLVGDQENPVPAFQAAIIEQVAAVVPIAPADEQGKIIGEKSPAPGVINYACERLGLCAGFTQASYRTTTEVYPDSAKVSPEQCIEAQVTAVTSGLEYLLAHADLNKLSQA